MKVFILLFLIFLSGYTYAYYYDAVYDDGGDTEDEIGIPVDIDQIKKEISKHEVCFKNFNCTQCLKDPSCVWSNKATIQAVNNSTSVEIKKGEMCWSGGFMKSNSTRFTVKVPSFQYEIHFSTSKSRVHSLGCSGVSDAGWLSMMIIFPIMLTGAFTFILLSTLKVERVGFYEKI